MRRELLSRFTFTRSAQVPLWSPDAQWIYYSSGTAVREVYRQRADGSGEPEALTAFGSARAIPESLSKDGSVMLVTRMGAGGDFDLWLLSITGEHEPRPFVQTQFNERGGRFSPDGRHIAYASNESGQEEVFVRPYLTSGAKVPVSNGGGSNPVWSPDGNELFYRDGSAVMAVRVATDPSISFSTPTRLFDQQRDQRIRLGANQFDVSRDQSAFLMVGGRSQLDAAEAFVVFDWFEELKRRVPMDD